MAKQQPRASSARYVSRLTSGALAVVMAGGRGERLQALTEQRCKPATPFGGKFRIIDFVLSNCVNSGIRQIYLMTQYKGQSLIQHVQRGWSYLRGEFGEFIDVVPAQQQVGKHWYRGTADCVYQNLDLIRALPAQARAGARRRPHLQDGLRSDDRLPRREGRRHHRRRRRGAARARERIRRAVGDRVEPRHALHREAGRTRPDSRAGPTVALASMGIYIFNARLLEKLLIADAADPDSAHDFGKNVIPAAIDALQVVAYPFTDVQDARTELLARRRYRRCVLRCQHRAGARGARAQPLRRGMADLDLPAAPAAGEVRAGRGWPARHRGELDDLRRVHHLRAPT